MISAIANDAKFTFYCRLISRLTPMSILSRLSSTNRYLPSRATRRANALVNALVITASITALGLAGCGQKGALYLVDTSDQAAIETSSAVLASGSQPQDTAFDNLDDTDYDKTRYLERKQILPTASDDPNDY